MTGATGLDRGAGATTPLACPACRARFRERRECTRCGADLGPLMQIAAQAHALRLAASRALRAADVAGAHRLAAAAEDLHATPPGRRLVWIARCLLSRV